MTEPRTQRDSAPPTYAADLSFAMTDLDLDVRRAALDVDPGWVDWLGCWVRFHYRDRPPEWPPAAPSGPAPGTGG